MLFRSRCARRGDSERRLNELQRLARATAISADARDGQETLRLLLPPPRSLCASAGHSPHRPSQEPLYSAVCALGNNRVAHALCSHADEAQLLYAIDNKYMPGLLRTGYYDLLIDIHPTTNTATTMTKSFQDRKSTRLNSSH